MIVNIHINHIIKKIEFAVLHAEIHSFLVQTTALTRFPVARAIAEGGLVNISN